MRKETKRTEILTDVPEGDVNRIIEQYHKFDGVTDVKNEQQGNGKFKITAVFPVKVEDV